MNINDFEMMLPMKYFDPDCKTETAAQKRQDMLDNKDHKYIATEKNDGEWGCFIHYSKGHNLIRSRSISVKTGKYGDKTEHLPHLVAEMDKFLPDNTVILAEICWDQYGTVSTDVGTILRCLAPKAVERQKGRKLMAKVFDVLMWNGEDMTKEPYEKRVEFFSNEFGYHFNDLVDKPGDEEWYYQYFHSTKVFEDNFAEAADSIINAGGEGIVIQLRSNEYLNYQKTAVSWATLKVKQKLPEMEVKVVGTVEPNKYYDGIEVSSWPYWEGIWEDGLPSLTENGDPRSNPLCKSAAPVTKPYFMGWKVGVRVQLDDGTICDVTSGTTDDERALLATQDYAEKIANGELYAVIKGMMRTANDDGTSSIRHPVLVRLRDDM